MEYVLLVQRPADTLHGAALHLSFHIAGVDGETGVEDGDVFDVRVQDRVVLQDYHVAARAGGAFRAAVEEFDDVTVPAGTLTIHLDAKKGTTKLSGVELIHTSLLPADAASYETPTLKDRDTRTLFTAANDR